MNEICPACMAAAKVRDTKVIVWVNCDACGLWACSSPLFNRLTETDNALEGRPKRALGKVLQRKGYGTGKHCLRVLLYDSEAPNIAPLVDVVPVHLSELRDASLLTDGRLEHRENAFRGEYNRMDTLLNPGAFADGRFSLP